MSELLLNQNDQAVLTTGLFNYGLFGVKERPEEFITLKSGRKSPHYLDIRPGISDVNARKLIVGSMWILTNNRFSSKVSASDDFVGFYDKILGTPEAMTSYGALIADKFNIGILQPRVDMNKTTGNKSPVLGRYIEGDVIAAYDDVVTDGASKIETIAKLGHLGLVVEDYFVVVDREEGGAPQVQAETGLEITPALGVSTMANILIAESLINQTQYDNVVEYINQYGEDHSKATVGIY